MATNVKPKEKIYVDIPTNLDFHPIKKDLTIIFNDDAVKRSLRNICLTNYYERLDPTVGANLSAQLFELAGRQAQIVLEDALRTAIENHEPRVSLISLRVAVDPDNHTIAADIVFTTLNTIEPITLSVMLNRVR